MLLEKQKNKADRVIDLLPSAMRDEIRRLASGRRTGTRGIREIRLRRMGLCSILIGRERLALCLTPSRLEMDELILRLTEGAMYAHRDSIASGYISIGDGIRVGICGHAAYENNRLVGTDDMRSLLFRIPSGECDIEEELREIYGEGIGRGMLIYSPPGVGKTTALRSLAGIIGGGSSPRRVVIVDERCEFSEEDYRGCEVDILSGYKRSEGVEIATRTLSPEVIVIDEIGAEDARSLLSVARCGVPLIASAHASDREELFIRPAISDLLSLGVFSVLVGLSCLDGRYSLRVDRL